MSIFSPKLLALPIALILAITPANSSQITVKDQSKEQLIDPVNNWLTHYEVIIMVSISLGGTLGGVIVYFVRGSLADKDELKQRRLSEQLLNKVDELVDERFSPQLDALDRQVSWLVVKSREREDVIDRLQTTLSKIELDVGLVKHTREDLLVAIDAQMAAADAQLTAILTSSLGCDTKVALYRPSFRKSIKEVLSDQDELKSDFDCDP